MANPNPAPDIAVLQSQMVEALKRLDNLDKKLDMHGAIYLTRSEWTEWKRGQNYQRILIALITAIVVGVIEYGIIHK